MKFMHGPENGLKIRNSNKFSNVPGIEKWFNVFFFFWSVKHLTTLGFQV